MFEELSFNYMPNCLHNHTLQGKLKISVTSASNYPFSGFVIVSFYAESTNKQNTLVCYDPATIDSHLYYYQT